MDATTDEPIRAAGGVVYQRGKDGQLELLLIKKEFGFWTLPKGHVKPGENEVDAVAREIAEETGLRGVVGQPVRQVTYTIFKKGQARQKTVTYYLVEAQSGKLHGSEKERIHKLRWFSVRAALKRIQRGRVRRIAREGATILQGRPAHSANNRE